MESIQVPSIILALLLHSCLSFPSETHRVSNINDNNVNQLINSVLSHSLRREISAGGSIPISPELIPTFTPRFVNPPQSSRTNSILNSGNIANNAFPVRTASTRFPANAAAAAVPARGSSVGFPVRTLSNGFSANTVTAAFPSGSAAFGSSSRVLPTISDAAKSLQSANTATFSATRSGGNQLSGISSGKQQAVSSPVRNRQCLAGFTVRKGLYKPSTKAASARVYFQDVVTNAGGWVPDRQQFEAPCTGLYYFTFNAVSTEDEDFTIALMKEGEYQVTAYGSKGGYQWGSNSAVLFLNPGDRVYLELQQGNIYEHPYNEAYTTFTGFLVNQL